MWAVNEADLFAQTASGYVHVVMLHYGLGVSLAVADLLEPYPMALGIFFVKLCYCDFMLCYGMLVCVVTSERPW